MKSVRVSLPGTDLSRSSALKIGSFFMFLLLALFVLIPFEQVPPRAQLIEVSGQLGSWEHSTGGKQKLGAISKMGERTIRRLLILGASAVVRWAGQRGTPAGSWLARMLARKPKMLVTVALANKTARIVWALLVKGGVYRAPAPAA
jgi:hypothetical protein